MEWTKSKLAALAGVGILLTAGTAIIAVKITRTHHATAIDASTGSDSVADRIWELYSKAGVESEAATLAMTTNPPATSIRTTQLHIDKGGGGSKAMASSAGQISMGAALKEVLSYAYDISGNIPRNRIIVPPELDAVRSASLDRQS